jgi:hypothetical protein
VVIHAQLPSIVSPPAPKVVSTSQSGLTTLPALPQHRFLVKPTIQLTNLSSAVIGILGDMGVSMEDLKTSVYQRVYSEMIGLPAVTAVLKSNAMFNVEGRTLNNKSDFLTNAVPLSILGMAALVSGIINTTDDISKQVCENWFDEMQRIPDAINFPEEVNAEIQAYTDKIPELLKQVLFLHYLNRNVVDVVIISLKNITKMIVYAIKSRLDAIKAREDANRAANHMTTMLAIPFMD